MQDCFSSWLWCLKACRWSVWALPVILAKREIKESQACDLALAPYEVVAHDVHLDKEEPLMEEQSFNSVSYYPIPYPLPTLFMTSMNVEDSSFPSNLFQHMIPHWNVNMEIHLIPVIQSKIGGLPRRKLSSTKLQQPSKMKIEKPSIVCLLAHVIGSTYSTTDIYFSTSTWC